MARMKAAGGIMLGKTNTPTFGWIGATHNLLFGITRNPWNLDRTPGGSSGGASAAAAAGLGPLHVGTDGGGSIRIPASCTGIFGFKPSFGRVPIYPASGAWSLSHVGPDDAHGGRRRADAAGVRRARRARSVLAAGRAAWTIARALSGPREGLARGVDATTSASPTASIPTWRPSARGRRARSASSAAASRR